MVRKKFGRLAAEIAAVGLSATTPESLTEGLLATAVNSIANAIKKIPP